VKGKDTPMRRDAKLTKARVSRKSREIGDSRIRDLEKRQAESLERENLTGELLQEKSRALTEALDQQTATSEILRVISSSPTVTSEVGVGSTFTFTIPVRGGRQ
jgi:hypothetical protein